MSGVCFPLAVLSIVARAVAVAAFLCWIKMWTDAAATPDNGGYSDAAWVGVLGALCACDLLFGSLAGLLLALSFRRLSSRLHGAMLRSVLLSPVSFFEATPRGRLLNRFSNDLNYVDCQFYVTTKEVLQTVTVVLARLAVVGNSDCAGCQRASLPGHRLHVSNAAAPDRDQGLDEQRALLRRGGPRVPALLPPPGRHRQVLLGLGRGRALHARHRGIRWSLCRARVGACRALVDHAVVAQRNRPVAQLGDGDSNAAVGHQCFIFLLPDVLYRFRTRSGIHQATTRGRCGGPHRSGKVVTHSGPSSSAEAFGRTHCHRRRRHLLGSPSGAALRHHGHPTGAVLDERKSEGQPGRHAESLGPRDLGGTGESAHDRLRRQESAGTLA
ncbi:hypothetical protein HPB51_009949 [Rhipicephalus microplus]|uniref:ABC transmembrane type-1 domain-containing protein n=1 Tax=Rhipicephalus microplus TaxID=6941 RepID=A0A9J6ESY7_RHIMP|nr:hypothetical protein HPB51_009949 [Rhipicephalus microplus]